MLFAPKVAPFATPTVALPAISKFEIAFSVATLTTHGKYLHGGNSHYFTRGFRVSFFRVPNL